MPRQLQERLPTAAVADIVGGVPVATITGEAFPPLTGDEYPPGCMSVRFVLL